MATTSKSNKRRTPKRQQPKSATKPAATAAPAAGEPKDGDGSNQILKIDSLAPARAYATIDNVRYFYRGFRDMGSIEHQEFSRSSEEYDALWAKQDLDEEEQERYDYLLDYLLDHVLMDPEKLRENLAGINPETGEPRLTGGIKRELVLTFTNAPLLVAMAQQMASQPEDSSTSES